MRRRLSLLLTPLLVGLLLASCAPPPSIQTEPGKRAWQANEFVKRVGELQNAAIQAESTQGLTTAQARVIVTFCVSAAKTAKDYPAGWEKTAQAAYANTKTALGPTALQNPTVAFAMALIEGMLDSLNGGVQ